MKKNTFSVIVTVFNLGAYLKDCIDSINLASNGFDVEVIVIDDGSYEIDTIHVIKQLRLQNPAIKFYRKDNGGPASARNYGISIASGDYILPFDADNMMKPDFFSILSNHIDGMSQQFDVLHFNALFFGLKNLVWPGSDFTLQDIALENRVDVCACIKRNALIEVGGFDESFILKGFEDWELWIRMLSYGKKFHYIDEILYDYRVREHSTLAKSWIKRKDAINHIFGKPENRLMADIRRLSIANHELKKPLSFVMLLQLLIKKIFSRVLYVKR